MRTALPCDSRAANRGPAGIRSSRNTVLMSIPIFVGGVTAAALAIFNYQKMTSPIVASTMYALRVHPAARAALGSNIQFRRYLPIIFGEMNQAHGRVDIHYTVQGDKNEGTMVFRAFRRTRMGIVGFPPGYVLAWECAGLGQG